MTKGMKLKARFIHLSSVHNSTYRHCEEPECGGARPNLDEIKRSPGHCVLGRNGGGLRTPLIYFILLSAFMTAFLRCGSAIAAKGIEFTISLDKAEYKKTEAITIDFKLKNKTDKPVYINKRFNVNSEESPPEQREVSITVIAPSGEKLPFTRSYETGLPKSDYFAPLDPGEEAGLDRPRNMRAYFEIKDAGTYKITADYQNACGDEIGLDAFKDNVKSNTVTMKITE